MEQTIFKKASVTYYGSSRFFPKKVREDVFKLYSFVRVADDYVDALPQQTDKFYELKNTWKGKQQSSDPLIARVVANIHYLSDKYDFDRKWVDDFLCSMEWDLEPKNYRTLDESLAYVYGSADVIGLMMARIMNLPEEAAEAAAKQGRAMQWINFIRDINEDNELHRSYFPQSDFKKFGLKDVSRKSAEAHPEDFKKFVRLQLERYEKWQAEAAAGYKFIPKRYQIAVKSASDLYNWTGRQIAKDPFIVYERKIKPGKLRVFGFAIVNFRPL